MSRMDDLGRTLFEGVVDRAHLDGLLARAANLRLEITDLHQLPD